MKKLLLLAMAAVMCSGCVVLDPNVRYEIPRVSVAVVESYTPDVVYEEVVYERLYSINNHYYDVVDRNREYIRERNRQWRQERRDIERRSYESHCHRR